MVVQIKLIRVAVAGAVCAAVVVLGGCSGDACEPSTADCSSQVRIGERVYTSHGFTERAATRFAKADVAECQDTGCDPKGSVFSGEPTQMTVWSFEGYSTDQVVGTRFDDDSYAVFVADSDSDQEAERLLQELASPES